MNKKYEVQLQSKERETIEKILHSDSVSKGIRNRCLILLLADESKGATLSQIEIGQRIGVSKVTVYHKVYLLT